MKFSHVLLAAPFVAGALAAPAVSQNTKDLPTTEGDCVAAKLVWDGAACAAPACAKGEKLKGGECVKATKNNNKGKNNNKKGKKPNQNVKKPNKPNKKKPKKPELTEEEKEQKKIEEQQKKEEKEQKKQEKKEKDMQEFADSNGCNRETHDVLGSGDKMKCVEKCDVTTPYRSWVAGVMECHDCSNDSVFQLVTEVNGVALDSAECRKLTKKEIEKKEREALEQARKDWALANNCTGDVFGDDSVEKPFKCEDTCGSGMFRGWNKNGPMCHDCTAKGLEVVTNDEGESKCKKVKKENPKKDGPKKEKPKKDGPKKDGPKKDKPKSENKGKGKGKDNGKTGPNKGGDNTGPNKGGDKSGPKNEGDKTDPKNNDDKTGPKNNGDNTGPKNDGDKTGPKNNGDNGGNKGGPGGNGGKGGPGNKGK